MIWNPLSMSLTVCGMTEQFINVIIFCLRTKNVFQVSFVYGLNKLNKGSLCGMILCLLVLV